MLHKRGNTQIRLRETPRRTYGGPYSGAVQERTTPQLERDQSPELETEILPTLVPLDELQHVGLIEDPAPQGRTREQQISSKP